MPLQGKYFKIPTGIDHVNTNSSALEVRVIGDTIVQYPFTKAEILKYDFLHDLDSSYARDKVDVKVSKS